MNEIADNPVVANEVNNSNTNNLNNDMNNIINFSNVLGEAAVAHTATVDPQVIKDIFNAFMSIPESVNVTLKHEDGFLKMIIKMEIREKFSHTYKTFADIKLIECILQSMRKGEIGSLNGYNSEEHHVTASDVDPRVDIFNQFLHSPFRCQFDADLVTKKGDRYICAIFRIGYKKDFKFYLKRTEEVEAMINEALKAA